MDYKDELIKEVAKYLESGMKDAGQEKNLQDKLGCVGDKAVDFFVQLAAALVAGSLLVK